MPPQHQNLAAGRWFALSLAEQMGNIGSEVGRAVSWRERDNKEYFDKAFARALELIDLTLADDRWKGSKRKEIARVREALCEDLETADHAAASFSSWDKYFSQFALMARARRELQPRPK